MDPKEILSPLPGKAAPQFSLAVFAPGQAPLEQQSATPYARRSPRQVVVFNFWASWCLACRDEHTGLSAVARRYAGKPVRFVGSLYQDSPSNGTAWIAEMGGQSYPSVRILSSRTAIDYGLYGVPETFFIGADGHRTQDRRPGRAAVVMRIVDSLLAASQPSPK